MKSSNEIKKQFEDLYRGTKNAHVQVIIENTGEDEKELADTPTGGEKDDLNLIYTNKNGLPL